jgi:hypothetical protein
MAAYSGKPDAVDYSYSHPSISGLVAAGIRLACRYLSHNSDKNLTASEAQALHAAGIGVLLNWEQGADSALDGNTRGVTDGRDAANLAASLGAPHGRTIYFSVDWSATTGQYPAIDAYFRGVKTGLAGRYEVGVYGHAFLIEHLHSKGLATGFWQTYAWSGGRLSSVADLYQYSNGQHLAGGTVDYDKIYHPSALGAWWPDGHAPAGGGTEIPVGDDMTPEQDATLTTIATSLNYIRKDATHEDSLHGVRKNDNDNATLILAQLAQLAARVTDLQDALAHLTPGASGGPAAVTLTGTITPSAP